MTPLAMMHVVSAVTALASGAVVLLRPKGNRPHKALGWIYVASMLVLNASALGIYRLFGRFGPFHFAALLSLATLVPGVVIAWRKRPRFAERHYFFMTFSYVGLLSAAAAEVLVRVPRAPFWGAVVFASAAVGFIGAAIIRARARAELAGLERGADPPAQAAHHRS